MKPTYLGDGVFVEREGDYVVLTTSNGEATTNRIVLDDDVWARFLEWACVKSHPSAAEERMRQALRLISHRCERQARPAEEIERAHVLSFLEQGAYDLERNRAGNTADMYRDEIANIKAGRHLPGGKLQPTDPKAMLTCKAACVPPSMRCASCKAYDGLGLDAETGEPLAPTYPTPKRSG